MPVSASSFMADRRPPAKSFQDLLVWRKAHEFVLAVYKFTADLPKTETHGLAVQMRQAAVSIPANQHSRGISSARESRQGPLHEYG
jgi:hypothetical protein